jgi:hypothetical protein
MGQLKTTKARKILQPGDRFLDANEAADILGTTANTLGNQRSLGYGPKFYRIGRSVRYLLSDLTEYGMRCEVDPGDARS